MREDGKTTRIVYVGSGVKSVELIDPPKKKAPKTTEAEPKIEKSKKD